MRCREKERVDRSGGCADAQAGLCLHGGRFQLACFPVLRNIYPTYLLIIVIVVAVLVEHIYVYNSMSMVQSYLPNPASCLVCKHPVS